MTAGQHRPDQKYGRARYYDVSIGQALKPRDFDRKVECRCGWDGIFGDGVPYRDSLGISLACPACARDLIFYM